jgi:transposase
METRIIGLDLAITASHKAIVLDAGRNEFVSPLFSVHTDPAELAQVVAAARHNAPHPVRLLAVMEATGMAWYPVCAFLAQQGVELYRVNGQQVRDLRRIYQRHAKSDRIDARVLARLPLLYPDRLHQLTLPSGRQFALQRACREVARLKQQVVASKNRIVATDRFVWLGLADIVPPYEPAARWIRSGWYNPYQVHAAGVVVIRQAWQQFVGAADPAPWIEPFVQRAARVCALYGPDWDWDFDRLQANLQREQRRWLEAQREAHELRLHTVRPLYRQLQPHRYLETIRGIGQDSAAVYVAFIGELQRFPTVAHFRGWSGLIPCSAQSGTAQAQGLHITQSGPDLIKAAAFLNANIARRWDPQLAAIYFEQMMHRGKHHNQAVCACATHLLARIYAVLHDNRPYELQDVDGRPVTRHEAQLICQEQYQVPPEARRRTNCRARQARAEQQTEQRYLRRHQK